MKNDKLQKLRNRVDVLDRQLLELLNQRAEIVKEISEEKSKAGLAGFDSTRERKIIEKLLRFNRGPLEARDIEFIMESLFKVYRSFGRPLSIAYFGQAGTFTHQTALKRFGERDNYISCKTIEHVFREVEKGGADFGVVPIENSNEGVVIHTLDMFVDSDMKVNAEIFLEVHHYLLSKEKSLKDIRKVYSHYQALGQCQGWLDENLPHAETIETPSTTAAIQRAKVEKGAAAIGSEIASKIYGMNILAERIEDFRENITRFLVIGRTCPGKSGNDKTSILFSIKDRVGALHDMLVPFKENRINLTSIESRPTKKKAWEYVFFVDFIGHMEDEPVKRALAKLGKNCVFLRVLGSYPRESRNG